MLGELVQKIFKQTLGKLYEWMRNRYCPSHVVKGLVGDQRTLVQRFWSYNKYRIIGKDGLTFLSLFVVFLFYLQLRSIGRLLSNGDPSFEILFPATLFNWSQYALQIPIFAFLLLMLILLLFAIWQRTITWRVSPFFVFVLTILILVNTSYGLLERWIIIQTETLPAFELAETLFESARIADENDQIALANKYYAIAGRLFRQQLRSTNSTGRDANFLAHLAQVDYHRGKFRSSILDACESLRNNPDASKADIAVEALRGSIYSLAHKDDKDSAEAFLSEVTTKHRDACTLEASPYWLAISPQLLNAFKQDPFQQSYSWWHSLNPIEQDLPWDESLESQRKRYEQDIAYLSQLVKRYPDATYKDYALFLLGRYRDVIVSYQESPILDKAYYAWGLEAFGEKDYQEAIRRYEAFLVRFEDHDWQDDAVWRTAKAYFELKDYPKTIQYLSESKNDPRGGLGGVDPYYDIAYVADVFMSEEEIQNYLRFSTDDDVNLILTFTLGEKAFASGQVEEAQRFYEEAIRLSKGSEPTVYIARPGDTLINILARYSTVREYFYGFNDVNANNIEAGQSLVIPPIGIPIAQISYDRIEIIEIMCEVADLEPPQSLYDLAMFLSSNRGVFRNSLWDLPNRAQIGEGVSPTYFMSHDTSYRIAEILESLLSNYPDFIAQATYNRSSLEFERGMDATLYEIATNYHEAASDQALQDPVVLEETRVKAVNAYRRLLSNLPQDSKEFDKVFEAIGSLYLHHPDFDKSWPWRYTEDDMRGMRREYTRLVNEYPNHHLANNALNWLAWSYCYSANLHTFGPDVENPDWAKYDENYRKALDAYRQLAKMNPLSGITQNARYAMTIIEDKLRDPDKRKPVPEERWNW
jgi:tetratricopeptide (TPR) repeat protein